MNILQFHGRYDSSLWDEHKDKKYENLFQNIKLI